MQTDILRKNNSYKAKNERTWTSLHYYNITTGRRQSKTLSTVEERGSKIARNSVFDCHMSPVGRQMAIENTVSSYF